MMSLNCGIVFSYIHIYQDAFVLRPQPYPSPSPCTIITIMHKAEVAKQNYQNKVPL